MADEGFLTPMPFAELVGVRVTEDRPPDCVRCELTVTAEHLNQAAIAQGGALFTLADTALGLVANRAGAPAPWVGTSFTLALVRGLRVGDVAVATASTTFTSTRLALHTVELSRGADGKRVGSLHAQSLLGSAAGGDGAGREVGVEARAADHLELRTLRAHHRRERAQGTQPPPLCHPARDGTPPPGARVFALCADGLTIGYLVAAGEPDAAAVEEFYLHPAFRDAATAGAALAGYRARTGGERIRLCRARSAEAELAAVVAGLDAP